VEWVTTMALFTGLVKLLTGLSMIGGPAGRRMVLSAWPGLSIPAPWWSFSRPLNLVFDPVERHSLNNLDQLFGGQVALDTGLPPARPSGHGTPRGTDGLGDRPWPGAFEFRNVTFTYAAGHPALVDASMSLAPRTDRGAGGRHPGAGKTTFTQACCWASTAPDRGQVLIDDVPIEEFQTRPLRAQMAVVAQDNLLLAGTVRYNVLLRAVRRRKRRDMEQACRMACALGFSSSSFQGLGHGLGAEAGRGVMLSGGQKQRLAIGPRPPARSAHPDTLDEATSALDRASSERGPSSRAFERHAGAGAPPSIIPPTAVSTVNKRGQRAGL